jgi:hypothetical protein
MRRLRWYTFAVLVGILCSLPFGLVWLIALPVAIWTHVILWKKEVKDAFDLEFNERLRAIRAAAENVDDGVRKAPVHPAASTELQMQTRGPAGGLMLVGILAALFWVGNGYVQVNELRHTGAVLTGLETKEFVGIFAIGAILVAVCGCLILGALRMAKFRAYELCVAVSILAMLPWSPAVLIGLPIGIWALRVLRRDDIMAAFQAHARVRALDPRHAEE